MSAADLGQKAVASYLDSRWPDAIRVNSFRAFHSLAAGYQSIIKQSAFHRSIARSSRHRVAGSYKTISALEVTWTSLVCEAGEHQR
jgi:hypothetical protein